MGMATGSARHYQTYTLRREKNWSLLEEIYRLPPSFLLKFSFLRCELEVRERLINKGEVKELNRKQQIAVLVVFSLVLFGGGYKLATVKGPANIPAEGEFIEVNNKSEDVSLEVEGEEEKNTQKIIVHIVGAVENPGVYELPIDSRVVDAIEVAGALKDARLDLLNLAAPLADGTQVAVFSEEDYIEMESNSSQQQLPGASGYQNTSYGVQDSDLININTAGSEQLQTIVGIGPALAERIIDYRNKNGNFLSIEDIKSVSGIGEKRYEQLKEKITI